LQVVDIAETALHVFLNAFEILIVGIPISLLRLLHLIQSRNNLTIITPRAGLQLRQLLLMLIQPIPHVRLDPHHTLLLLQIILPQRLLHVTNLRLGLLLEVLIDLFDLMY
jgi:hypothetical protein